MARRVCLHIGWSNSLGWYEGFRLLTAVDPTGVTSRALASVPLPPLTSWRPKPSSPPEPGRTPDSGAWARPPRYPTWSTRASRGQITTSGGSGATERSLSLPAQTQRPRGVAQAFEALGSRDPPDRREHLRQAFQYLRPLAGATSPASGVASAFGGKGSPAQLRECE
jgi:hypothetical protein